MTDSGDTQSRPRYQRLFVRVLIVQIVTLIGLWLLQSAYGP